jgi:lipoprotein-anchoring transpeptidase ErfK/SrfK
MRNRSFIVVAGFLAVLLVGAVGVFAFDRTGRATIPKGVHVAGIDVGGLSAGQARAKLERDYLSKLREPIVVHHGSRTFTLTAARSQVAANLDGMVEQALDHAREGSLFARTWRRLTGGSVHVEIPAQATYSKRSAISLVDRVRRAVDRPAQDASVSFAGGGLARIPGHDGLAVLAHRLHQQVDHAIIDPYASHVLVARTRHVAPKVTDQTLEQQYDTTLIVDRSSFQLKLYKHLKLLKTYSIAVGMQGLETPAGLYHIQNKAVNPVWNVPHSTWAGKLAGKTIPPGPDDPLKARWLGIFAGAGIHGIDPSEYGSIGHAASHGCVRMRIPDVIDLYDRVPVGAPIYIA